METLLVNFTVEYMKKPNTCYILNNQQQVCEALTLVTTKTNTGSPSSRGTSYNYIYNYTTYIGQYNFSLQNLTQGTYNLTIVRLRAKVTVIFTIDATQANAAELPEFPSWVILPIFLMATVAVVMCRNRLRRKVCVS